MSKQHYQLSTYRAQNSIGYLVKRAHSLMLDVMEPLLEARGFSFVQYVILAWLRDGIAVNAKDICAQYRHDSGAMTRVIDQLAERVESLVANIAANPLQRLHLVKYNDKPGVTGVPQND